MIKYDELLSKTCDIFVRVVISWPLTNDVTGIVVFKLALVIERDNEIPIEWLSCTIANAISRKAADIESTLLNIASDAFRKLAFPIEIFRNPSGK